MGGFAVVVDWDRPIDPDLIPRMMEPIGHRCTGGIAKSIDNHVNMTEGWLPSEGSPQRNRTVGLGSLMIVGDIRLHDRQRLRAIAGPDGSDADDDRRLILRAWRRHGRDTAVHSLDGEFAFVIVDRAERTIAAVRDQLGVRSLFYEIDQGRFRAGTELKQLSRTSPKGLTANTRSVAEYVSLDFGSEGSTFLAGYDKVPAASVLTVDNRSDASLRRYWRATPSKARHDSRELPQLFREHLIASVERRLTGHDTTASQLSGGIDSSAIAASIAAAAYRRPINHVTVSAVFDMPSIDETHWINDTVATLPFDHERFVPRISPVADLGDDMLTADSPYVNPIRDLIHQVGTLARNHEATILLTGEGGDYVLDQHRYLADIARTGQIARFIGDARSAASFTGSPMIATFGDPLRMIAPTWMRRAGRAIRPARRTATGPSVLSREVAEGLGTPSSPPSDSQLAIAEGVHAPLVAILNELQDAHFSRYELEVSHPFFDRQLVEFVVNIDPRDLPFDGRSKTLARQGFEADLPASVLARNQKTVFNEFLEVGLSPNHREFRDCFPELPAWAGALFDGDTYRKRIAAFDHDDLDPSRLFEMMRTWHVLAWMQSADITASD